MVLLDGEFTRDWSRHGSDVLESVLGQNLVNVLSLVNTDFSRVLLNMHSKIPGALAFIGDLEGLAQLCLELQNCLQILSKDGHVVYVKL